MMQFLSKNITPKQTKVQGMFSPGDGTLGGLYFLPFTAMFSFFYQLHALLLQKEKKMK